MEETTQAFAVLAALTLAVAPVTNGVLERAAETADRVLLEPADWQGDPPEDPPNGTPPEDLPEGNRSYEVPQGARPSCSVDTEPRAGWNHTSDPEKQATPPNRTRDFPQQTVTVNETHIGVGVALRVENLTGALSASLVDPDGTERFSYEHPAWSSQQTTVNQTSTIPREELVEGEWTAELSFRTANYDRLSYVIVTATCSEDPG
jgi:hypothetical protein